MAGLMSQRMVSSRRGDNVRFWAWMASIAVHLIVLTAFGFVKFYPCRQQAMAKTQGKQQPVPVATVSQIKKLIEATPVTPKPKVKEPDEDRLARRTNRLLPVDQIFDTVEPCSQAPACGRPHSCRREQDWQGFAKPVLSQSGFSAGGVDLPKGIEFFGSRTDQRKVCYLVDCSGSMQGIFGRVRKELAESIQTLQPDQYFSIIFFGDGKLFGFGDGRPIRATEQAKSAAYDFIGLVQPAGQTNAMEALEKAVQIGDGRGFRPSVIYFLTDGFELTTEDTRWFSQKITNLLARFAPTTRINTIGFWPASEDRKVLKTIARQSGGECVFITGGDS